MHAERSDNELLDRSKVLRLKSEMLIRRQDELHAKILRLVRSIQQRRDAICAIQFPNRQTISYSARGSESEREQEEMAKK
jgi:hypothetical protein